MKRAGFALAILFALALMILGLAGAYSYGSAYSTHRGFVSVSTLRRAGHGRLLNVNFYSRALHREAYYIAYLPPGYNPAHRYPVYYMLHGMPGRPQAFVDIGNIDTRLDNEILRGHLKPMILVFPDGRMGGSTYSDSEWANTPTGNYDDLLVNVVGDVDRRFSTVADRRARVIGGLSAGAYGAINVALHHLDVFSSVQVWSGYFVQSHTGVFAHAPPAAIAYNSPLYYAATLQRMLRRYPLRAFMFVGRGDRASRQLEPMARELVAGGADVQYAIDSGGHDWAVWYPRLNRMLDLAYYDATHPLHAGDSRLVRLRGVRRSVRHHHAHRHSHSWRAHHRLMFQRLWHPPAVHHVRLARHHRLDAVLKHRSWTVSYPRPQLPSSWLPGSATTRHRAAPSQRGLVLGLLLAIFSAAAINFGFLLQHRGLVGRARGRRLAVLRSREWLSGQAVGWVGFGAQIIAVAIAPLSLVQAFAVGGLALSVPLAAGIFGHRVTREQMLAVVVIAVSLASLPIALSRSHGHMQTGMVLGGALVVLAAATAMALRGNASLRAIAAGGFYGVADAAIKAVSVGWRAHGSSALVSGWTVLAIIATFCGFLAFQIALRDGNPVSAITLMTALTALIALAFGVAGFRESLGLTPAAVLVHLTAIGLVLACVGTLAGAQQQIAEAGQPAQRPRGRIAGAAARAVGLVAGSLAAALALLLSVLAGFGLLYGLRGLGWFAAGPRIGDSLPLLQLAGFDGQPLARVAVAWLAAGLVLGVALIRIRPLPRGIAGGLLGVLLLLFASEAAFALARNLRLSGVLHARVPGLGAWLEGLLFALGVVLPGSWKRHMPEREPNPERRPLAPQRA